MRYGASWYPEQWPSSHWKADLELMRHAGMNVVRLAEFSWSNLEPSEGVYDFGWLEEAISLAASFDIATVLGTPTATPPAWLTRNYPGVLLVNASGDRAKHGGRCHFSVTSPAYRAHCAAIATKMAESFGQNASVIGWQIDNEFNAMSFDETAAIAWANWLVAEYQTLDNLNTKWGTAYWSQTYFDWADVPLGIPYQNPCLQAEWRRFMTQMYREYQLVQIRAIRSIADSRQWITHNVHGVDWLQFRTLAQDWDLASYDQYLPTDGHCPYREGATSDYVRSMSKQPHWIMETQIGHNQFSPVCQTLNPGETRRLVWHQVGHGAQGVLYWQWRAGLGSHEQFWGTVIAPDGRPRPIYSEAKKIGLELAKLSETIDSCRVVSKVALLHHERDIPAQWAQRHHEAWDPSTIAKPFYTALRVRDQSVDVVSTEHDLTQYCLLIAPSLYMISDQDAKVLEEYVRQGGTLLFGPRSGVKTEWNSLQPHAQPGKTLSDLLGASVREFYALPAPIQAIAPSNNLQYQVEVWAETLENHAPEVQVLLRYEAPGQWMDGAPAAVGRKVEKGWIGYLGAHLATEPLDSFLAMILEDNISGRLDRIPTNPVLAPGLEICRLENDEQEVVIVINNTTSSQLLPHFYGSRDLLTGEEFYEDALLDTPTGSIAPNDVEIFSKKKGT